MPAPEDMHPVGDFVEILPEPVLLCDCGAERLGIGSGGPIGGAEDAVEEEGNELGIPGIGQQCAVPGQRFRTRLEPLLGGGEQIHEGNAVRGCHFLHRAGIEREVDIFLHAIGGVITL